MRRMLTGNSAAAWGARVSDVDYVAAYPITPQSEIVETLSNWVAEGLMKARFVNFESEHSMITAAGAAALTGARAFTATSSQGLFYAFEALYTVSGWRAPIVLVNVARGVGMPMVLQVEHGDVLAARDSGFIQLHAETCQEVLDFILMGYRIGEDHGVLLPVIVNMDGFVLSFTREPVEIPEKELVEQFLPPFSYPRPLGSDEGSMVAYAPTVTEGAPYTFFKYQLHMAALRARQVFGEAAKDFRKIFGREHDVIERFMMDDAECAVVCSNSYSSIIRAGVERLRQAGLKVGMVRLKMIRPFPSDELREALSPVEAVAVFEQNISPGKGSALYPEIVEALYHSTERPSAIVSFVGGLGGANIGEEEVDYMVRVALDAARKGRTPKGPILVFREDDWMKLKDYLKIAGIPAEVVEAMHHV
uniref:Pyruvate synthase n=1 Tax=Caldiarchaeum subterraneum TaxID=311458 RepID=A0A7C5L830_CALS0